MSAPQRIDAAVSVDGGMKTTSGTAPYGAQRSGWCLESQRRLRRPASSGRKARESGEIIAWSARRSRPGDTVGCAATGATAICCRVVTTWSASSCCRCTRALSCVGDGRDDL